MMNLSKNLRKILVSGVALVMLAGAGASASTVNVNARHVRTHRVYRRGHMHRHSRRSLKSAKRLHARRKAHKHNVHKYNVRRLEHKKHAHKLNTYRFNYKHRSHRRNAKHYLRLGHHHHGKKNYKATVSNAKHNNAQHPSTLSEAKVSHANHYISSGLAFMQPDEQSNNGLLNTEEPSQNDLDLHTAVQDLSEPIANNQYKMGLNTFNGHNYWFQTHTTFFNPKPMVNMYRLHAPVNTYNNLTKDVEPDIDGSFDQDDAKHGVNDEGFYTADSHEWPTDQNGNKLYNLGHFFLGRTNEPGYYND